MTLASWTQQGRIRYDKAIVGIPFLDATRGDGFYNPNAYLRSTSEFKKEQIDQTTEPGEQSLKGWWYRSQSSFHLGAGIRFFNPVTDPSGKNRFNDSCGVNVFTAGQVSLLRTADTIHTASNGDNFAVGYSNAGTDGALHADGTNLTLVSAAGATTSLNALLSGAGNSTNILGVCSDGGAFYLISASGVFSGDFGGSAIKKIYSSPSGTIVSGSIYYVKQQLIIAYNNTMYLGQTFPMMSNAINGTENPPIALDGNNGDYYFSNTGAILNTGVATPPASTVGNNGDYYYNTITNTLYGPKFAGAWPTGNVILTGAGIPANTLGANTQWYYDTTNSLLIGPKANNIWPTGGFASTNLIAIIFGPKINGTWPTNTLVITGTGAPGAGAGVNTQYYLDTTNSRLYGPKAAGAWPGTYTSLLGNTSPLPTVTPFPFTQSQINWKWTGAVDGPGNMFFSGYSGDQSYIYGVTFEPTTAAFTYPATIAELPRGEIALSLNLYLGTYLIIGTNLGVRVGILSQTTGTVTLGALSIPSNTSVGAVFCYGNYVWTAGAKAIKADATQKVGLFRMDLSNQVNSNLLLFPYQRDIYAESITYPNSGSIPLVQSVCNIGYSGRVAYTVQGVGLVFEDATNYVTTGWIDTGRIRMDTGEDKIFQSIRVNNYSQNGNLKVSWKDESNTITDLYSWATQTYKSVDTNGSDALPHSFISYRFTLSPYSGTPTITPVFIGYTARTLPSNIRQRDIRISLLCYALEKTSDGHEVRRDVFTRIQQLEAAEKTGAIVLYQDFNTGEQRQVLINNVSFSSVAIGDSRKEKSHPDGILTITLKAVD